MGGIRLRTKFLLSMVAVSAALTFTTLLVVRHTVQQEVRLGIQRDLENSVSAFHNFQTATGSHAGALGRTAGRPAQCSRAHDHARSRDHPGCFAGLLAPGGQRLAAAGRLLGQGDGAASHAARDYGSARARNFFPFAESWHRAKSRVTGGTSKGISTKFSSRIFILAPPADTRFWDTCCSAMKLTIMLRAT